MAPDTVAEFRKPDFGKIKTLLSASCVTCDDRQCQPAFEKLGTMRTCKVRFDSCIQQGRS